MYKYMYACMYASRYLRGKGFWMHATVFMHACLHVWMNSCKDLWMYACMHVCT